MRDRAVWALRALWFVLPLAAGPGLVDAASDLSDGSRRVVTIGSWVLWGAGLGCVAVLLPATLTGIRILAPGVLGATVAVLAATGVGAPGVAGVVVAVAIVGVGFSSLVGDRMVDGASYGDERRMLLSPPTRLVATVVPITWIVVAIAIVAGPLWIGAGNWVGGTIVTIVGLGVAALGARALHQLSQRWVVFVPNGFVLHDLQVLTEPVLFRRTAVERLGAAIEGTPARDLTNRAAGLILECELTDPAPLGLRSPGNSGDGRPTAEMADVRRFLFTPSRPGALLDEAERRRIPVG